MPENWSWDMVAYHRSNITKNHLLDVAEILFAQNGFDAVSVREITAAAKCNMGAVNYHFQSKKSLGSRCYVS